MGTEQFRTFCADLISNPTSASINKTKLPRQAQWLSVPVQEVMGSISNRIIQVSKTWDTSKYDGLELCIKQNSSLVYYKWQKNTHTHEQVLSHKIKFIVVHKQNTPYRDFKVYRTKFHIQNAQTKFMYILFVYVTNYIYIYSHCSGSKILNGIKKWQTFSDISSKDCLTFSYLRGTCKVWLKKIKMQHTAHKNLWVIIFSKQQLIKVKLNTLQIFATHTIMHIP